MQQTFATFAKVRWVVPARKNCATKRILCLLRSYAPGFDCLMDERRVIVREGSNKAVLQFINECAHVFRVKYAQPCEVAKVDYGGNLGAPEQERESPLLVGPVRKVVKYAEFMGAQSYEVSTVGVSDVSTPFSSGV
ncbi:hypothetical protein Q760_06350 [Cellulomonas cellasea DSM 20118]|uniref:Uncharacterized protein n=1 Tax=Cellulomonas cellasea DSM 20118 TaxID=1408250 RepID=A0A0A0B628_9CELL|nr:hypothetical protein Q760_06350 [Cellulomonas cellasea DSM 20118]